MNDYMSRNEVINRLQEIANDYEDARDMDAFYVADYCLKHIIELRPAADVRPVVRGEWVEDDYGFIHCSICGTEWDEPEHPKTNFCPSCGADMREVEP